MVSRIQSLLEGREEVIDYNKLVKKHRWIIKKKNKCILSPDSDGLLCGLFLSNYLNWEIVGFYDGKVMLLKKDVSCKDCVFLDIEVFRKSTKSIGHHMLQYNKRRKPSTWNNFDNCIQPNNMRDYDGYHDFRLKYPLATIHLLIGIIGSKLKIKIPESAICALLFTDGTFNVLFKYPENVLNWLNFLKANEKNSPLKNVFENKKYSVFSLMVAMDNFFRERDKISVPRERGDRLRISKTDGTLYNFIKNKEGTYDIKQDAKNRIVRFIKLLSRLTKWVYIEDRWTWKNLNFYKFTKRDFSRDRLRLNNRNFDNFILKNPLSWAMTNGQNIEYTLEQPDKLP